MIMLIAQGLYLVILLGLTIQQQINKNNFSQKTKINYISQNKNSNDDFALTCNPTSISVNLLKYRNFVQKPENPKKIKTKTCPLGYITDENDNCTEALAKNIEQLCNDAEFDLIIVMDGSNSIRSEAFAKGMDFLDKLVQNLNINENGTRVTVLQYSQDVSTYGNFMESDPIKVRENLQAMKQDQKKHNTFTNEALYKAWEISSNYSRTGINQVILTLTDGYPTDGLYYNNKYTPDLLHDPNNNIISFVVGIGAASQQPKTIEVLSEIASKPVETHLIKIKNYDVIDDFLVKIEAAVCQSGSSYYEVRHKRTENAVVNKNREIYVRNQFEHSIYNCNGVVNKKFIEPGTLGGTSFTVSLNDVCSVIKSSTPNFLSYSIDFYMPPMKHFYQLDDDEDNVITDWGSAWTATCNYDRLRNTTLFSKNYSTIVPAINWNLSTLRLQDMNQKLQVTDFGNFEIKMQIYQTNSFTSIAQQPYNYNMNQRIFAQVDFINGQYAQHLSLKIEKCWATPEKSPRNDKDFFILIKNGCSSTSLARIEARNGNRNVNKFHSDRFSTQAFKWPGGDYLEVYIHCQVLICQDDWDCEHKCRNVRAGKLSEKPKPKVAKPVSKKKPVENRYVSIGPYSIAAEFHTGKEFTMRGQGNRPLGISYDKDTEMTQQLAGDLINLVLMFLGFVYAAAMVVYVQKLRARKYQTDQLIELAEDI